MAETFTIDGLKELETALNKLEKEVSGGIVMDSMRTTVRAMRSDIARSTPKGKTGNLRKSVRMSVRRRGRQLVVSKTGPKAPHAHLVIGGTKPHVIRPKRERGSGQFSERRALYINGVARAKVSHPGSRPNDFLTPVFSRWERQFPPLLGFELRHRIYRINFPK